MASVLLLGNSSTLLIFEVYSADKNPWRRAFLACHKAFHATAKIWWKLKEAVIAHYPTHLADYSRGVTMRRGRLCYRWAGSLFLSCPLAWDQKRSASMDPDWHPKNKRGMMTIQNGHERVLLLRLKSQMPRYWGDGCPERSRWSLYYSFPFAYDHRDYTAPNR